MLSQSPTEQVENFWSQKFVEIYNNKNGKNFVILPRVGRYESPDVQCRDPQTGEELGIEIKRHESIAGDIRNEEKGEDLPNSLGMRGNFEKMFEGVEKIVQKEKESGTKYTGHVALLLVTYLKVWTAKELVRLHGHKIAEVGKRLRDMFPAGVWFFCHGEGNDQYDVLDITAVK